MKIKISKDVFAQDFSQFKVVAFPIYQCYKCLLPFVRNYTEDKEYLELEPNPNCSCWTDEVVGFEPLKAPDLKKFEITEE